MNRTEIFLFRTIAAVSVAATLTATAHAQSQQPSTSASIRSEVFANSHGESYLRYLQTAGLVPLYPWSSRAFSARELNRLVPRDSAHPWSVRFVDNSQELSGIRYGVIDPSATLRYNSSFAYGSNDGPVWAGRGLTSATQLGFYALWGPVSLTVAPIAFRAQNQAFDIVAAGRQGNAAFADPNFGGVDRPQRFGNSPYTQVDPGQTTLRVDVPYVAVGISTANQVWGPGQELPVILGNNAAGFPHLFAGTSEPLNILVGTVHAKVVWGELFQSEYSNVTGPERYLSRAESGTKRFATGFVVVGQVRGITGLEVGASRFFHSIWPRSGIPRSYYTKFLQGLLKKNIPPDRFSDPRLPDEIAGRGISDNQLISIFGRWVLPRSGFEVHAEYGRDDHSYDFRDLLQEPDHSRAYSIGARKIITRRLDQLTAARVEIMNFQLPQLSRYRGEGEMYVHGLIRQGHTNRGQLLGADAGVGIGAGSVLAVDRFTTNGRWTATWSRILRQENGNYTLLGVRSPRSIDVTHALGFEASRFISSAEITAGVTLAREFNRDFSRDATNVNALFGLRYLVGR